MFKAYYLHWIKVSELEKSSYHKYYVTMAAFALIVVLTVLCIGQSVSFLIPDGIQKVTTQYGDIIGFIDTVHFDNQTYQVRKFLGIPYAEPPVGKLRLKKPVMKTALPSSPFRADKFGPVCPQSLPEDMPMSEDCLFLNIYTPAKQTIGLQAKPVMIWVHGGAFIAGASNYYNDVVISSYNDVIVVTLNYRLGALGFFSTHDQNAKGNYGLWDQHLAFRWVYENIGAFGGENTNMTIFGESAGSSSVVYQMLYPGNEGIFKRVIAESGTIASWGVANGDSNYESSLKFGQLLGCNDTAHVKVVSCLQRMNESDIVSAAVYMTTALYNEVNVSWVPIYDDEFVPAKTNTILDELTDGDSVSKYHSFQAFDLMIGANNYDGLVFMFILMPYLQSVEIHEFGNTLFRNFNASENMLFGEHLSDFVIPRSLEAHFHGEIPTQQALQLTEAEYTPWSDPTNITLKMIQAAKLFTDYAVNVPTVKTATAHTNNKSRTYLYQFSNAAPTPFRTAVPLALRDRYVANHADELQYLFSADMLVDADDIRLSKAMMTLWTNFAKSGNPNYPAAIKPLYDVRWPEYDVTGHHYLEINDMMSPTSVKQRLAARAVQFWDNVLPKVQGF